MDTDRTPHSRALGRFAALIALLLLVALAVPSIAAAKRGLETGFADPEEYQSGDAASTDLWMGRTADAADAGIVRLAVEWYSIAPSTRPADPTNPGSTSYDFSAIDGAVRAAANHGLKVLLTINHAPVFAEGAGRPASAPAGSWEPNPSDLADFAQAVAARYSGGFDPDGPAGQSALPAAYGIQVWNEPNSSDWLAPQFDGKRIVGAELYRSMLNAAYKSIKQVNPGMQVVVGGTDPYGDPPGGPYPPNVQRVRPVEFWDAVFCVRQAKSKKGKKGKKKKLKFVRTAGCSSPALFDVFAHHPIDNTGGGPLRHGPSKFDASTPDLSRVVNVLRAAERFGTASGGHHPVWVTEFWWDSKPPNQVGAPLATQARWIEQSMYLFWKAGASAAISFQIADSTLRPDVHAGLQAGVYFNDGRPKPSLTAFSFPFVTDRINSRKLLAWGKAPAGGKLRIQRRQGSRWITVKKLGVSKGSVFTSKLTLRGKQRLRAIVSGRKSLVWKQAAVVKGHRAGGGGPSVVVIALLALAAMAAVLIALRLRARRVQFRRDRGIRAAFAEPA